ncbi:unnamed protein product [Aphanomyces euteiches]|nr:hypothetical protein Ae201684P_000044 [Aphanomyces euteiches]
MNQSAVVDGLHPFFDCFRSYKQVDLFLEGFVASHPTYISKVHVTTTVEGRKVFGYKLSSGAEVSRRVLYIQGGIHPREWIAISSTVYAIVKLVASKQDKALAHFDVVVVPLVNIDGYRFTWASPTNRLWRKNSHGVDLNRNFGPVELFQLSDDVGSETYPGPSAMSEPETQGIANYLTTLPSLSGTLDIHTNAGMVLRPLSVKREPLEGDHETKMERVGAAVAEAMNGGHGKYVSLPGYELYQGALYAGTFKDMVYLSLRQTPSLTIELKGGDGFIAPSSSIRPAGDELVEAIHAFATQMLEYDTIKL